MVASLSVLWGGSFFFVEVILAELPTLTIVSLRVAMAAATLWLFVFATGGSLPSSLKVWLAFLVMGLINNVIPFSLIVWGQTHIASGLAAILNATTPLFAVFVAGIFLADEKITLAKLGGVGIDFVGVVVMIGPAALAGIGDAVVAQIAVLAAALSYAFAGVFGRRFKAMNVPPVVVAAGQVTASSLFLAPIALWFERPWQLPVPGLDTMLALLGLAVMSTAVAYVLYFRILARAGAINLLLVTFLIPVSAILLGALVLGERLESVHLIGMALIGAGLAVIDGRPWLWLRS